MRGTTHLLVGAAVGVAIGRVYDYDPKTVALCAALSGLAALVPDWLQLNIPGLNKTVKGVAGHRGFSHWLLTAVALYYAADAITPPGWWSQVPPWAILAGYVSHIALDALNNPGVPALWPLPWRLHLAGMQTGGAFDRVLGVAAVALAVVFLL